MAHAVIAAREATRLFLVSVDIFNQPFQMSFEHVEPDQRMVAPNQARMRSTTADWPGYYCKRENDETAKPPSA
ncbi:MULTISPECIES: hypothetical protein [Burkholderia]|uniref:hypothetical protein n=1 Tax=Burkholderia TaxID=32008 RepID=UPI001582054C|nr:MULTISPECIES: hypothetical protein [Burkholderia]MCA8297465.1 hypothetical protein [Burkholderia sp. AU30198]